MNKKEKKERLISGIAIGIIFLIFVVLLDSVIFQSFGVNIEKFLYPILCLIGFLLGFNRSISFYYNHGRDIDG